LLLINALEFYFILYHSIFSNTLSFMLRFSPTANIGATRQPTQFFLTGNPGDPEAIKLFPNVDKMCEILLRFGNVHVCKLKPQMKPTGGGIVEIHCFPSVFPVHPGKVQVALEKYSMYAYAREDFMKLWNTAIAVWRDVAEKNGWEPAVDLLPADVVEPAAAKGPTATTHFSALSSPPPQQGGSSRKVEQCTATQHAEKKTKKMSSIFLNGPPGIGR
jgi:hypothetical protein